MPPYLVTLRIPGRADALEAIPGIVLAGGARLFVDVNGTGAVQTVAHFRDVALRGRASARRAFRAQLKTRRLTITNRQGGLKKRLKITSRYGGLKMRLKITSR